MRTTNRAGQTLCDGAIERALADGFLDSGWALRLVDTGGNWVSTSGWEYHEIPQSAFVDRGRELPLRAPGQLTITLLADELPDDTVLRRGYRIEIDRLIGPTPPNDWPYFTGIVDDVAESWAKVEGAYRPAYKVTCFGLLQRTKGYWINSAYVSPAVNVNGSGTASTRYQMTGYCSEIRGSLVVARDASNQQILPGASLTYDLANTLVLDNDSAFGSPYTYTTHYTVVADATTFPAKITWDAAGPADGTTVYYKYPRPDFFGLRRYLGGTLPQFFRCPYGRDPRDLYQTQVSSYSAGPPITITPMDPYPYDSDAALLDPSGQVEYLAILQVSTGTLAYVQISSTSSAGVITLGSAPSFTPVAGDLIWVGTTELFPAWGEWGLRGSAAGTAHRPFQFWQASSATLAEDLDTTEFQIDVSDFSQFAAGSTILIDSEQFYVTNAAASPLTVAYKGTDRQPANGTAAATHSNGATIYEEYSRNQFAAYPNSGIAVSVRKHWGTSDSIHVSASPLRGPEWEANGAPAADTNKQNRAEEILKILLGVNYLSVTGIGLFANDDVITAESASATWNASGAWIKSIARYQLPLSDLLQEFKDTILPAGTFVYDEVDGKAVIRSVQQASIPDLILRGDVAIEKVEEAEPYSRVVVLSEDPEVVNMAPFWLSGAAILGSGTGAISSSMDANLSYVVDDNRTLGSSPASTNYPGAIQFTVPGAKPLQAFPVIQEVKIHGTAGYVSAYVTQGSARYQVPGAQYRHLTANQPVTISGENLARAAACIAEGSDWTLNIQVDADDTSGLTAAVVTEIEIPVRRINAYACELTDDPSKVPASYQPTDPLTQFGEVFVMSSPGSSAGAGTAATRVSYLWAPTAYLERISAKYDTTGSYAHVPRTKILRLNNIAHQEARTYAEEYLLEETYVSTTWSIAALLDPRIERADTLGVPWPDGTVKNLLCEDISDGGNPLTHVAQYLCTDRSATRREAA